ncbi:unnamed protein product [Coregonus sp. 'balchen']|nr:unnamed protein product [Coregonus sp. 'balchen']
MSTDCENLLKKFLILNPTKRGSLEQIMKDRWMNVGHEEEELKPYIEPMPDYKDPKRTEIMIQMGYSMEEVQDSLVNQKYNEVMATYLLLDYTNHELDEGIIKPRPGNELSNSNAPSPPSKVQRSVSSNQKPRRATDQGLLQGRGQVIKGWIPVGKVWHCSAKVSPVRWSPTEENALHPLPHLHTHSPPPHHTRTPSPLLWNSILSSGTGRSRNSPLSERASLGQGVQNGKDRYPHTHTHTQTQTHTHTQTHTDRAPAAIPCKVLVPSRFPVGPGRHGSRADRRRREWRVRQCVDVMDVVTGRGYRASFGTPEDPGLKIAPRGVVRLSVLFGARV